MYYCFKQFGWHLNSVNSSPIKSAKPLFVLEFNMGIIFHNRVVLSKL